VEEVLTEGNGVILVGPIFDKFGEWIYSQRSALPTHDMAVLATKTKWEGHTAGVSKIGLACQNDDANKRSLSIAMYQDDGDWQHVKQFSHEIGHK